MNSCILYQKHYSCEGHQLHLGERIKHTVKNKFGYIYDVNPLNSKRSFTVLYDDNQLEKVFGFDVCSYIEKTGDPKDMSRIHPKYQ